MTCSICASKGVWTNVDGVPIICACRLRRTTTLEDRGRKPLVHRELNAEEATRMNPDLTPKNSTPPEVLAAQDPGLPAAPKEALMPDAIAVPEPKPLISKTLLAVAAAALPALYAGAALLPMPWGIVAQAVMYVPAYLLGVALPVPKVLAGKAIVTIPGLGVLAAAVGAFATTQPDGLLKVILVALSLVLAVLTGLGFDQPQKA